MADKSHPKAGLVVSGFLPASLIIIGVLAYSNSFSGPFIFDDIPNIVENPNIRQLWPLTVSMSAPAQSGLSGRPILSLSFALNYALGEYRVWGYHLVNLTIHILAALTLYGIVRITLLTDRLKEKFGQYSASLACITAAIWLVHPIQTESVSYIVQRAESLMGLLYLLTVYTAARSMQPKHSIFWPICSVVFCAIGMATKEVMATAPVMVLFYDRTFVACSFLSALKKRWPLYLSLSVTWLVLAVAVASGSSSDTIGFSIKTTPFDYAMNQFVAVAKYIKLSFWPARLCLYYSSPIIRLWDLILPPMLLIIAIATVALWGFVKNRVWSYPIVWFFTILAPTSSFVPIADIMFEHRVYLSLAGLVIPAVMAGFLLLRFALKRTDLSKTTSWLGLCIAAAVIIALTTRTIYRNRDYHSALSIWQSVVEAVPTSYNGYTNLGGELQKQGKIEQAIDCYLKTLSIKPDDIKAHHNLGSILKARGQLDESAYHYRQVLLKDPNNIEDNFNLGVVLQLQNKLDQAIDYYHRTLKFDPNHINAHNNLGAVLVTQGSLDKAIRHFDIVLKLDPNNTKAYNNLAYALVSGPHPQKEDVVRAVELAQRAAVLTNYQDPEVLDTLADCYSKDGQADFAVKTAEKALELALAADNKQLVEQISNKLQFYKKQVP
ncbi:MAG: tetratricopeptide repeat protein [Sedimentisphaerales bacterium]